MNNGFILVVEDSQDDEELALRALKKANVANAVEVVRDGAEAVDFLFKQGAYADRRSGNPAVVLLDLKLPKLDGIEVLDRIRQNEGTRQIPVVMLTSSDEQDDMVRSYRSGANSYVRKPVEFGEFTAAVKQLGLYWMLLNKVPAE